MAFLFLRLNKNHNNNLELLFWERSSRAMKPEIWARWMLINPFLDEKKSFYVVTLGINIYTDFFFSETRGLENVV